MSAKKQKEVETQSTVQPENVQFVQIDNVSDAEVVAAAAPAEEQKVAIKSQSSDSLAEGMTEGQKASAEELELLENNIPEETFSGPVFTEDPDEPAPASMVSHICALCANFPCRDLELNKHTFQPFPSSSLKNSYKIPPCKNRSNFLVNFDPVVDITKSLFVEKNTPLLEQEKQNAEIERDKALNELETARQRLTIIMGRLEVATRKFSENNAENCNALRNAVSDSLRTLQRNVIPSYRFDN